MAAEQALAKRGSKVVEKPRCKTAGRPLDPAIANRRWQGIGKGATDKRAITAAFPPAPARDLQAMLDDELGDERIEHRIGRAETWLEIGLDAQDGRDVGGLAGKRGAGGVEPGMMPVAGAE